MKIHYDIGRVQVGKNRLQHSRTRIEEAHRAMDNEGNTSSKVCDLIHYVTIQLKFPSDRGNGAWCLFIKINSN